MNISLDDATAVPVKTVKTFNEKGRGRKQCDSCKVFIGVRTKVCICGKSFVRKVSRKVGANPVKKSPVINTKAPKESSEYRFRVQAPAGKCPFPLKDTEYDTVKAWADKIRKWGEKQRDFYTLNAIKYYARYFYGVFTEEYKIVESHLDKIYESELQDETNEVREV